LFAIDPRYQKNEHRPPVYCGCDQSLLISHITLANNSSALPMLRLCYTASGCWRPTGSWQRREQAAPVEADKELPWGPAALSKGGSFSKPLLVTAVTRSRAPLPTASLRGKIVWRQKRVLPSVLGIS